MPALQKKINGLAAFICIVTLIGCSRDNPLILPEEFVDSPDASCTDSNVLDFEVLTGISIFDSGDKLLEFDSEFDYLTNSYELEVDYLTDELLINPQEVTSLSAFSFDSGDIPSTLPEQNIVSDELASTISLSSLTPTLELVGEPELYEFPDNASFVRVPLINDSTELKVTINVQAEIPYFGIECTPFEVVEVVDPDDEVAQPIRTVHEEIVYNITIRRSEPEKSPVNFMDRSENDEFGRNISLDGDFLAVGLPHEDSDLTGILTGDISSNVNELSENSGAVYIYRQVSENNWEFHSLIKAPNSEAGDLFGYSVSLSNNLLIVSAPGEDSLSEGSFTWIDENSDGVNDDDIAANAERNNLAPSSGAVYAYKLLTVYEDPPTEPEPTDPETTPVEPAHWVESIDAASQVVSYIWIDPGVPVPADPPEILSQYWTQKAYIKPKLNQPAFEGYDNAFGQTVLFKENILLVSAPKEDSLTAAGSDASLPNSGAVFGYAHDDADDSFTYITEFKASNALSGDSFGSSIAMSDGRIIIGAPGQDSFTLSEEENDGSVEDMPESGAAYIFDRSGSSNAWTQTGFLKASNADIGDSFGDSVAVSGNRVVVGASNEDGSGLGFNRNMESNDLLNSGAAYVFDTSDNETWIETKYIKASDTQENASFGRYVAFENDDLLISAPYQDQSVYTNVGQSYLYSDLDEQGLLRRVFTAENPEDNLRLGENIDISNTKLVIGSSGSAGGVIENSGTAFIFQ